MWVCCDVSKMQLIPWPTSYSRLKMFQVKLLLLSAARLECKCLWGCKYLPVNTEHLKANLGFSPLLKGFFIATVGSCSQTSLRRVVFPSTVSGQRTPDCLEAGCDDARWASLISFFFCSSTFVCLLVYFQLSCVPGVLFPSCAPH